MATTVAGKNGNARCRLSVADQHDLRHRQRVGVRNRQKRSTYLHALGTSGGTAVQLQPRWSTAANDLDVLPQPTARMAGAKGLHGRLFGGKSAGEVRCRVTAASTIGDLTGRKHALQKTIAIPFEHVGEAGNVGGVEPD